MWLISWNSHCVLEWYCLCTSHRGCIVNVFWAFFIRSWLCSLPLPTAIFKASFRWIWCYDGCFTSCSSCCFMCACYQARYHYDVGNVAHLWMAHLRRLCEDSPTKRVLSVTLSTVTSRLRTDFAACFEVMLTCCSVTNLFMPNQRQPRKNLTILDLRQIVAIKNK